MGEGLVISHCEAAIRRFFDEEVQNHGTRRFQFLAPDAPPFYPYITSVHTPRKYAVGKYSPFSPPYNKVCRDNPYLLTES